jgi:hypothetical protein
VKLVLLDGTIDAWLVVVLEEVVPDAFRHEQAKDMEWNLCLVAKDPCLVFVDLDQCLGERLRVEMLDTLRIAAPYNRIRGQLCSTEYFLDEEVFDPHKFC